ncbi:peroxidase 44-like [Spinacia oleracea]|uniref:Peroxidase n=1 Tax=Spinacia oleracea TaxID=3562 RepID=A0A9R0JUM2_SPIOL|nr:peroxidase 44-like [Spinacia oleracea]
MESFLKQWNIFMFVFLFFSLPLALAQLELGFYTSSCPDAEFIVQQVVRQHVEVDKSVPAALLRMHFHDCFIRGCDASILIDSTDNNQSEKEAGANASVREYELIDEIKNFLEQACRGIVSCADIITLATRDAIALAGGPVYNVPTGRLDGLISRASEVNLPGPASTVAQIRQTFRARGMTVRDMVLLVGGGHSIGVAHCNFFQDRLFNFQGTGAPDSTMDTTLLNELQGLCGFSSQVPNPTTFLDQNTSFVLDNEIYKQMKMNRGILQIDQELALDPLSSKIVSDFAADNGFFRRRFVDAIIKMGNLPGSGGEVRGNCRRINSATAQQSLLSSI